MTRAAPVGTKWSDDRFLDTLRDLSDPLADACARDLPRDQSLAFLFTKMRTDADLPPETEFPEAFATFLRRARPSLDLADLTTEEQATLERGQQVFMRNALPSALVLLSKSLQEGYQAPRLGKVLMMSGGLENSTYRRVLGVLQMLLQVATPGSFEPKLKSAVLPSSDAGLTAIKVRLMHAGLRGIALRKLPEFARQHGGVPISLEDLLATLMAFSALMMDGFDILRISLSAEDADAYHFVWRVFARTMGIHPPNNPKGWEYVPGTLAEAREFYDSYKRRHYRKAAENEEGVLLARANLKMLARRMPPLAARIYMHKLIGDDASRQLGIRPVPLMFLWKAVLLNFPRVWVWFWRIVDRRKGGIAKHDQLTQILLQKLIVMQYNAGVPSFRVPRDVDEIEEVVKGTQPGLNFGRDQFIREVFPLELKDIAERRKAVGLDAAPLTATGPPHSERGLVGLALSGGGIRSATFALGAVQALARRRCLKAVDYLSTVSGGGYLGSALSSVLNDAEAAPEGRAFPFNYEPGSTEPPAIRHLRNGSNYLAAGGLLQAVRLPMVALRGLLINAVLLLPYLMLAVTATWVLYPMALETGFNSAALVLALTVFAALILSYPAVYWIMGTRLTWRGRDWYESLQAVSLMLLAVLALGPVISPAVEWAFSTDWTEFTRGSLFMDQNRTLGLEEVFRYAGWFLAAVVAGALVSVGSLSKSLGRPVNRLLVYVVGVLGPAIVFGAYLLLVVAFVRAPFLKQDSISDLRVISSPEALAYARASLARDTTAAGRFEPGSPKYDQFWRIVQELRVREILPARVGWSESGDWGSAASETLSTCVLGCFHEVTPERGRSPVPADSLAGWRFVDVHGEWHSIRVHGDILSISGVGFGDRAEDVWFVVAAIVLLVLNRIWVNVNVSSPHGFYRDRLSRAFLIRARWYGSVQPNDGLKLSELGGVNPAVPYHLINASLNLAGSRVEDLPGRQSDFFIFSRRFVGSYGTGYCETRMIEPADPHLNLGTAMAVSAAAASPNAGTTTIKPLTFILTLLNIRLGYWLPNPWWVQAPSLVRRMLARARPGPWYLLREAMGSLHARGPFVNVSDGGHIENLGVYELLRRRCKLVIAVDAEADPSMTFPSLAKLIRYARTDLGIEITIELDPLRPDAKRNGLSHSHWAVGKIRYGDEEVGHLLYVKSSLTGDEPPYVVDYRLRHPSFPHESTADQFFDEAQFESYRAVGFHAANGALKALDASEGVPELDPVREALGVGTGGGRRSRETIG
ncbi:MAG: DUF2236 domain-containing protein [Gemmatimonadetes bacterium]|nr:DUF2236 domain-containing protein [Gemmatimonadota bacterium]